MNLVSFGLYKQACNLAARKHHPAPKCSCQLEAEGKRWMFPTCTFHFQPYQLQWAFPVPQFAAYRWVFPQDSQTILSTKTVRLPHMLTTPWNSSWRDHLHRGALEWDHPPVLQTSFTSSWIFFTTSYKRCMTVRLFLPSLGGYWHGAIQCEGKSCTYKKDKEILGTEQKTKSLHSSDF